MPAGADLVIRNGSSSVNPWLFKVRFIRSLQTGLIRSPEGLSVRADGRIDAAQCARHKGREEIDLLVVAFEMWHRQCGVDDEDGIEES